MSSPGESSPGEVTRLLEAWAEGDSAALGRVVPLVFDTLRRLAACHLRRQNLARGARQRGSLGHTLQPTALVHEAYLRLVGQRDLSWQCRAQFFAYMGVTMRRLLMNSARQRHAQRHGGGCTFVSLDAGTCLEASTVLDARLGRSASGYDVALLDLDRALDELQALAPRQARIVELRFFSGLTVAQTAHALDISPRTVKREWRSARLWLLRALDLQSAHTA